MWDAAAAGDWKKARELHYKLLPLGEGLFVEANPIPVKAALAMMGRDRRRDPAAALPAGRSNTATSCARSSPSSDCVVAMARPMRIAVLGADGRMGRALMRAIADGRAARRADGRDGARRAARPSARTPGSSRAPSATGVPSPSELPAAGAADVWIDFTSRQRDRVGRGRRRRPGRRRWSSARPAWATHARRRWRRGDAHPGRARGQLFGRRQRAC